MAGALFVAPHATVPGQLRPRAAQPTPASAPGAPLVLAGRGLRPVWSFVLQTPDHSRDRGSATVQWTPRGRPACPTGPVPLGARQTDLSILIESPEPVGGRAVATIGPARGGCTT